MGNAERLAGPRARDAGTMDGAFGGEVFGVEACPGAFWYTELLSSSVSKFLTWTFETQ
ncbi:MAG: hypothetical protein IPM54_05475 [Polyangiaceae bacterium]|nr:hypothetical protein [Polyangiaceae bacterium]